MSLTSTVLAPVATDEQRADIQSNLQTVREAIKANTLPPPALEPLLIAVSTGRSIEEILVCYNLGQRDFGEENAQELLEKANKLSPPSDDALAPKLVWHFLGLLTKEDVKLLEAFLVRRIVHVHALNCLDVAVALNGLPFEPPKTPLPPQWLNITIPQFRPFSSPYIGDLPNVLPTNSKMQDQRSVANTQYTPESRDAEFDKNARLAEDIVCKCLNLRVAGLTLRGTLPPSDPETPPADMQAFFRELNTSRDRLQAHLERTFPDKPKAWGTEEEGRLRAKMGRSRNFDMALHEGSDVLTIGDAIFGPLK